MPIGKKELNVSLRRVRGLYRSHARGELSPTVFITQARKELNGLYMEYTRGLIAATAEHAIKELQSYQAQFALDLECNFNLFQVARGYRGIRAEIRVRAKGPRFASATIFIGPFDEWNKIAVHTTKEVLENFSPPSLYTKRRSGRWKEVSEFDFPELLQRIKEEVDRPPSEDSEDDIPF